MAHQICVLTAFSEDGLSQSSTVVASVNCLELPADRTFRVGCAMAGAKAQSLTVRLRPD
jgi:hypothetical protein